MDINLTYKENREILQYIFWGVVSVVFNITSFFVLDLLRISLLISNSIAFLLTVLLAYYTNTKFVFMSNFTLKNFTQFFTMRIGTIIIDNFGLLFIISLGMNKLVSKLVVNALIIILNYLFSKFFIFKS